MAARASAALIAELEGAQDGRLPERWARILLQVTKLFLADAHRLNEAQVAVFDDQFFERRAHTRFRSRFVGVSLFGERGLFDQLKDLFQRGWRFGRVHNRFDLGFKTH